MCNEIFEEQKIIPISFDMVFKKMWGDPNGKQRLEAFLSIMLGIPYEKLKGKVEIIESEKRIDNKNIKRQRFDIVAKVKLNVYGKVNLEMNLGFDKTDIDRNLSFVTHIFNSGIRNKMKYEDIPPVLQIDFNDYDVDKNNNDIIDKYFLQNKNGNVLTEKLQIWNINIVKCYNIWYNKNVSSLKKDEQEIVKICALMNISKREEFVTCLGEIKMNEKVKKDIEQAEEEFSSNEEILGWYGTTEEYEALEKAKLENARKEAQEIGYNDGFSQGVSKGISQGISQGILQGISKGVSQGISQGIKQNKIETAKKLLKANFDIDFISKITGLTAEEINKIKKDI